MSEPNPELEPDAPDWSSEPASDELLAEQLQERGMNMSEVQDPNVPAEEEVPAPPDSPGVPAPDTSPPEEGESENGDEEEDDGA